MPSVGFALIVLAGVNVVAHCTVLWMILAIAALIFGAVELKRTKL